MSHESRTRTADSPLEMERRVAEIREWYYTRTHDLVAEPREVTFTIHMTAPSVPARDEHRRQYEEATA